MTTEFQTYRKKAGSEEIQAQECPFDSELMIIKRGELETLLTKKTFNEFYELTPTNN
jgi:hypothetical protein